MYDFVGEDKLFDGKTLCGCLTHCRRYYDKAAKVTESPSGQQLARVAVKDLLGKVFLIERQIDEQREARERRGEVWTLADTLKIRQERSAAAMAAFKSWVDEFLPSVPPKSTLGKALSYTVSQWTKLTRFLECPDIPARRVSDWRGNNTLRGVTVGRQCRCLSPRRVSRFQSLLIEPDMQISRIRLSRISLRPSRSPRLRGSQAVCRDRASHKDTRPGIGDTRCPSAQFVASAIAVDAGWYIAG